MIRGITAWVKSGFFVIVALFVTTVAIEPLYEFAIGRDSVQQLGWDSYASLIFKDALASYGFWIFVIGMFFVSLLYIIRRSRTSERRRV